MLNYYNEIAYVRYRVRGLISSPQGTSLFKTKSLLHNIWLLYKKL